MFVVNCALKVLIECHRGARFPTYFDWVTSLILPQSEAKVPYHTEANPNQWTPQDAHNFMMLLPETRPNIDSSLSTSLWFCTDQSEWFTRTSHRIPRCPVSSVQSTLCPVPSAKCWCSSCPALFALFMKPEKLCLSSKLMRSPIKRHRMLCKTLCEDPRALSWIDFCA